MKAPIGNRTSVVKRVWALVGFLGVVALSIGAFASPAAAVPAIQIRLYSSGIDPATDTAGHTTTYSLSVANAATSTQSLGSVNVTVPTGYTAVSVGIPSGSRTWSAGLSSGVIALAATTGTNKLLAGESISVSVTATAPCAAGSYEWTTVGDQDTPFTAPSNFDLSGGQPTVNVTGSCPVAPLKPIVTETDPLSPSKNLSPKVDGTAEAGSTVNIFGNSACSGSSLGSGTATGGNFAIPVTLSSDGTYTFYATATNGAGTSLCSTTFATYVLDRQPPLPPVLSGPSSPAKGTGITVDAAAEADSQVKLYASNNCSGTALDTVTATGGTAPFPVTVGANQTTTFTATATDAADNTSDCSTPYAYTEKSSVTTPEITASDPASGSDNTTPKLKGTTDADTTVFIHGASDCSDAAITFGAAANFTGAGLQVTVAADSTTTFYAQAVDSLSNVSTCSPGFTYLEVDPVAAVGISGATLDLGLKNSDDIGTAFDLRVEFSSGNTLMGSGELLCVRGIARDLSKVVGHIVPLNLQLSSGSELTVRLFTRIGTVDGINRCTGTGASHASAIGLRFYYDSTSRPSLLTSDAGPLYFHSNGTACASSVSTGVTSRTIDASGLGTTTHCQDSPAVKFTGGNAYQQIGGDWTLTVP